MQAEVFKVDRPKGRDPLWAFTLRGDEVLFRSRDVAVRYLQRSDAQYVAELLINVLSNHGSLDLRSPAGCTWEGDVNDDCTTHFRGLIGRAEWLSGPRRGGIWYSAVFRCNEIDAVFHTADRNGIQPRSGDAARWISEVVMLAADAKLVRHLDA